tara:strand:- start:5955 stop:6896 length:942 start_codon:yes stop_codon:yes gene_type:complete
LALLFTSGGGRLGNQLLNIYHLMAISYEYKLKVEKLIDPYCITNEFKLKISFNEGKINLAILDIKNKFLFLVFKLAINLLVRLIHLIYFLSPNAHSYKIGMRNNRLKFLIAKQLTSEETKDFLINKSRMKNIALSGWGIRDWNLVNKYKEAIKKNMEYNFLNLINYKRFSKNEKYLFVHIRRTDFLLVDSYKEINFSDYIWAKSINSLCKVNSLNKVIIFSDGEISSYMKNIITNENIKIKIPRENKKNTFLQLFVKYLSNADLILCNASTLSLSISFVFHDYVYLPKKSKSFFKRIPLSTAHNISPCSLNWK